jgi:3-hydroxyacyl-CoA dehydrogenase
MAGGNIRRVAAIGTGTIGASWTAVFLARGLTVAASARSGNLSAWICRRGLAEPCSPVSTTCRAALDRAELPHRAGNGPGWGRVRARKRSRA